MLGIIVTLLATLMALSFAFHSGGSTKRNESDRQSLMNRSSKGYTDAATRADSHSAEKAHPKTF